MTEAVLYNPTTPAKLIGYVNNSREEGKSLNRTIGRPNYDHVFIDKRGRPRTINPKKLSRKKGRFFICYTFLLFVTLVEYECFILPSVSFITEELMVKKEILAKSDEYRKMIRNYNVPDEM